MCASIQLIQDWILIHDQHVFPRFLWEYSFFSFNCWSSQVLLAWDQLLQWTTDVPHGVALHNFQFSMSSQGFDYLFLFFFACVFVVFSDQDSVTAVPGHTAWFIVHGKRRISNGSQKRSLSNGNLKAILKTSLLLSRVLSVRVFAGKTRKKKI